MRHPRSLPFPSSARSCLCPDPSGQPLVNVTGWISRTTLDIMGQAGFDFHFGSLDDAETEMAKMYANLL